MSAPARPIPNKKIQYFVREVYGNRLEYVKNPADANLILRLTGKKTITGETRELFRDISGGKIEFEQVFA